ncbi:FimD/PapC N-terminal domain-containing protein [Glaesserella parasuis]|uniref:FimD/PapC N-terminal domain-containing protein n=1 Tax=Glaesserella parasuis TaxID=738 RepID=UPI0004DD5A1C|nr:FimD/PapC N-terminal domain-containing protein [Glaesserella parasuis]KEZ23250.1 Heat shock protein E [Glaesserella parasuis]MCT8537102.1 fimbria/pilus outer membrane usher protein [Glaesserella parasuis]MCT8573831.1 fimbria/pilus outer membrane usher protein [Glaesserella parasuis]MCT8641090.1 fimbria/pilus outer membrane usher protein [Glaesserella parasuis]MCT8651097.1 fimbria/pilus outer membrane usher protein [Glaesserella parasuis]
MNNERRGLANIKVSEGEHNGYFCFTLELSQVLDLTSEAIQIPATSSECIDVDLAVPKGKFRFDYTVSRLHLEIPQIYVVQRPRGYISPHLWQTGVPVAFLNYDLNSYQHYGNTSYKQHYLALNGGINLGDWAFRHIGAKSWDSSGESSYHRIATYVKRPIVRLCEAILR